MIFDLDGTISDPIVDILAAHANGLPAIGVLWGYGSEKE
jgi:phosphoglycolate phosphatase-like HAD superfamily hydrolase